MIYPNAQGTVGMTETQPYRDMEELEVEWDPTTQCIGTGAFRNWENLKSVTYKGFNDVRIGAASFRGCCNLEAFSFARTGEVGIEAFKGCSQLKR